MYVDGCLNTMLTDVWVLNCARSCVERSLTVIGNLRVDAAIVNFV